MAKENKSNEEWIWHMQQDLQRKININKKLKRKRQRQQPSYNIPVRALYETAINNEEY